MTLASPTPTPAKAWITLLTNSAYLAGLLTVYRTLRAVSSYPLLVMVTESLPESSREILRQAGLTIIEVDHLTPADGQHPGFDPSFLRLNDAWTKLRVFGLTAYERLILIDSDMIFLRGMDELFDMALPGPDWIGAAPACICNPLQLAHYPKDWTPENCAISRQSRYEALHSPAIPHPDDPRPKHLLNSGLVLLQPSTATMHNLIEYLNSSETIAQSRFADQDVITEAFRGRWRPLPWWCNALKTERATHPDVWSDTEARLVHFILDKPWAKAPPRARSSSTDFDLKRSALPPKLLQLLHNTPPQKSLTIYDEMHEWWWAVYDEVLARMQAAGEGSGWKEMDEWVAK